MKLQAENRFTVNQALFLEGMLRITRETYGKSAAKAMLVFAAIWVALLLFALRTGGSLNNVYFALGVIVLLGIWLCVWTPRSNAKKAWKTMQSKYGDSIKRITRFYDDHLEITGDCVEKHVLYTDIRDVKLSRNMIILIGYDKVGIMLSRTGFTLGDLDTVQDLIRSAKE